MAHDINARGQVVGWIGFGSSQAFAFLWERGTTRFLDDDRASYSSANAINSRGDVVGYYMAGASQRAAVGNQSLGGAPKV